jgi:DegV family protein with EDD domain
MAHKIAIVTDTDSSIPLDLARQVQIRLVPIIVQFGDESFRDAYEMDAAAAFARIDREGKIPTTAAPSPGQFVEEFKAAFEAGASSIVCFSISSEMSATFQAARQAADLLPGKDITVIDTRTLSLAQGFMALVAANVAAAGGTKQEVLDAAEDIRQRAHLYASLSTLKYLAMSGRVGHVAAGIGGLLEVKPVLTVIDGKLQLLERVRTQGKSWARAVELIVEATAGRKIERLGIIHVNALDAARGFETLVRAALECPKDALYAEMMPGLSVHSGAGLVGAVLVTAK